MCNLLMINLSILTLRVAKEFNALTALAYLLCKARIKHMYSDLHNHNGENLANIFGLVFFFGLI